MTGHSEEVVVFTSMFPILSSPDLPRLLQFYVQALDAVETFRFPTEGEAVFVSCDEAVERLRAAGATVVNEPSDMEWGERVAQLLDPDGNLLHIGQAAPAG